MENDKINKRKNNIVIILVALIVLIGAYFMFASGPKMGPTDIAIVNGVSISKTAYDAQLNNAITLYKGQGIDVTNEEALSKIKKEVLDNLINNELLTQGSSEAGIKANQEEIEKQFQLILTQVGGIENLNTELAKNNLTETQLRENISKQIIFDAYLLKNIDIASINVSDEDVQQFYINYTKSQEGNNQVEVPPLTEISEQIKQQLISSQQQTMVKDFVDSLRAKADIEIATI